MDSDIQRLNLANVARAILGNRTLHIVVIVMGSCLVSCSKPSNLTSSARAAPIDANVSSSNVELTPPASSRAIAEPQPARLLSSSLDPSSVPVSYANLDPSLEFQTILTKDDIPYSSKAIEGAIRPEVVGRNEESVNQLILRLKARYEAAHVLDGGEDSLAEAKKRIRQQIMDDEIRKAFPAQRIRWENGSLYIEGQIRGIPYVQRVNVVRKLKWGAGILSSIAAFIPNFRCIHDSCVKKAGNTTLSQAAVESNLRPEEVQTTNSSLVTE